MARKKQEIALQVVIETQEEWEEMLAKEGLTVVDVFQEWAGPCNGMISSFKRLKNELGDDSLHFAVAKSDTIDSLEKYRGKCEPCFLFFAGGVLVAQIRGANAPKLLRMITEQLAYEHKVLEGNAERKEIKDPMLVGAGSPRDVDEEEEEEEEGMEHFGERIVFESLPEYADDQKEQKKGISVAIIKPNVVAEGKVEEILKKMEEAGIEILEQKEKTLTEEEAREFYAHKKDEEYFEDLIQFMTSGPSVVLVITKGQTGEGIIDEWRELLGPASVEEAKQAKPDSLRAQYGGDKSYVNALHGSDSQETAMRELAFFFPDFAVPTVSDGKAKPKLQRTLALIRPDALREKKDEILEKIKEAGFTVAMQKEIQLSREQVEEFYKEHKDEQYFEELINRMSSGPLLALALAREDAVTGWREMLGPKQVEEAKEKAPESLRAQFSLEEVPINQIHGSEDEERAQEELSYFFPMQQTVAVIKPDAYQTKDEIMKKIREAGFHIAARKETQLTREIAEQFYRDQHDKEYFTDLTEHMASGPTLFMVLSREDAVQGWRSLIGPTDPEQAKKENPETLRAQFGSDVKANAIHGSSSEEHALESMKLIFGELQFNPDGTVKKPEKKAKAKTVQEEPSPGEEEKKPGEEKPAGEEEKKEGEEEKKEDEDKTPEDDEKKEEDDKKSVKEEDKKDEGDKEKKEEAKEEKKDEEEKKEADQSQVEDDKKDEKSADDSGKKTPAADDSGKKTPAADDSGKKTPAADDSGKKTPAAEDSSKETPATEESSKETPAAEESSKETPAAEESSKETPAAEDSSKETPAAEDSSKETPAAEDSSKKASDNTDKDSDKKDSSDKTDDVEAQAKSGDNEKNQDVEKKEENKEGETASQAPEPSGQDGDKGETAGEKKKDDEDKAESPEDKKEE